MAEQRMSGDLDAFQTIHDDPGVSDAMNALEEAGNPESEPRDPEQVRSGLRSKCEAFEARVASHIWRAVEEARTARDGHNGRSGLYARYLTEDRKYQNEQVPELDSLGAVVLGGEDSHLKAGVKIGQFTDNVNTVTAWLNQAILGRGGRPYVLKPKGRKAENDLKTETIIDLLESLLSESQWRTRISTGNVDLPEHGAVVFRQSWVEKTGWMQNERRTWEERITGRGPSIVHWPLLDCYVSNPRAQYAEDQDFVVWYSQETLSRLSVNERITKIDKRIIVGADGQPIPLTVPVSIGRFINLERLRRPENNNSQQGEFSDQTVAKSAPLGVDQDQSQLGRVSAETLMDLYEFQGFFPMGQYVRSGELDAEMLTYYGVDLRVAGGEVGVEPEIPKGEALARLCDAMVWYLSVTDNSTLIEFQPCPYRRPRTELISGFFIPNGSFYGMSSDKLAADVGDTADKVLNDIVEILHNNADPPRGVMPSGIEDGTTNLEEARKAGKEPGSTVLLSNPSLDPEKVIFYYIKPYNEYFPELLSMLREIYDTRTLSSQLAKGGMAQTESNTLGEANAQINAISKRLAEIALRLSSMQIVVPIIKNLLDDLDWFYTPDELDAEAKRVAGEKGLEFSQIFATPEAEGEGYERRSLSEDFIVESAASADIQREVAIQFMLKMDGQLGATLPTFDRERNGRDMYALMGMDPDRYFQNPVGQLSPRKEFKMIVAGDTPKCSPTEDAIGQHLPEHQAQYQGLKQIQLTAKMEGKESDAIQGWLNVLEAHIRDTVDLAQVQAQMMMQAAQAQAAAAAPSGKGGEKGSGKAQEKTPPVPDQINAGLQTAAMQTPTASVAQ